MTASFTNVRTVAAALLRLARITKLLNIRWRALPGNAAPLIRVQLSLGGTNLELPLVCGMVTGSLRLGVSGGGQSHLRGVPHQ